MEGMLTDWTKEGPQMGGRDAIMHVDISVLASVKKRKRKQFPLSQVSKKKRKQNLIQEPMA